jgi:hypothetical protein
MPPPATSSILLIHQGDRMGTLFLHNFVSIGKPNAIFVRKVCHEY